MQKNTIQADKRRQNKAAVGGKEVVLSSLKGAIYGLIITVLSVLLFALIVKQAALGDAVIAAVNQIIKVLSIFFAALIATRCLPDRQGLVGMLAGVFYVVFGFLTFSLIEGAMGDFLVLLADLAMGAVIGFLTAVIFKKVGSRGKTPKKAVNR